MATPPLKRFTQCGSLTMLFVVFIVLFGVSSTALTTFGKTNPNLNNPTPPPIRARECATHADCASLENTSCVRDPVDARLRCLCGDNKPPFNGLCKSKLKGLRHLCQELINCEDGMVCAVENATKPAAFGAKVQPVSQYKVCLCDEADGWVEDLRGTHCSGALNVVSGFAPILLGLFIGTILAQKQMH
uniref:CSON002765 protein n=1 Tax=Culicoides sonorensis TaxID=179676 RepID=A0A336L3L3_CULSO